MFYVKHPSSTRNYIQCSEFGKAFVKHCPAGTIFTDNMACEKVNSLLPNLKMLAHSAPAYGGAALQWAPEQRALEASEFKHMCSAGIGMFYVAHPQSAINYIQCDNFGKAFVKTCAAGTIFTENMVCEKAGHLVAKGLRAMNLDIGLRVNQFDARCMSLLGTANVVYFAHPQNANKFIQCDHVGNAFLKTCPVGTVFGVDNECVFGESFAQAAPAADYSSAQLQNFNPIIATEQFVEQPMMMTEQQQARTMTMGSARSFTGGVRHQTIAKIKTLDMKAAKFRK